MLISQFLTFILLFPYKVSDKEADYFKATRTCEEDKGHLISLEDTEEIERLYKKKNATKDVTFFTSALYFSFETEWRWMSESSNNLLVTSKTKPRTHKFTNSKSCIKTSFLMVYYFLFSSLKKKINPCFFIYRLLKTLWIRGFVFRCNEQISISTISQFRDTHFFQNCGHFQYDIRRRFFYYVFHIQ